VWKDFNHPWSAFPRSPDLRTCNCRFGEVIFEEVEEVEEVRFLMLIFRWLCWYPKNCLERLDNFWGSCGLVRLCGSGLTILLKRDVLVRIEAARMMIARASSRDFILIHWPWKDARGRLWIIRGGRSYWVSMNKIPCWLWCWLRNVNVWATTWFWMRLTTAWRSVGFWLDRSRLMINSYVSILEGLWHRRTKEENGQIMDNHFWGVLFLKFVIHALGMSDNESAVDKH